nr:AraC family transcriptional regulator [Cohnella zeiphila]
MLQFALPPLPHYIASGYMTGEPGDRHVSRHSIGIFDLLFVRRGRLFIGEEDRRYEVTEDSFMILRPDCYHFGSEGCREPTEYFWLHFQATGNWSMAEKGASSNQTEGADEVPLTFAARPFQLLLPQFARAYQPRKLEELLFQLVRLEPGAHQSSVRLKEQVLFQEAVQLLAASADSQRYSPATACAEKAAEYLRSHYRNEITAKELGERLNFHPVYIARCMRQEYGCSPMEYLLRYRIEQSKRLLLQTDLTIARIAEEVGFNQTPYFSSTFAKLEGLSPRRYRERFSRA